MSTVEKSDTAERRQQPRLSVGNGVVLVDFCDRRGQVTCCLWDISARGACLMIPPDISIPNTFKIILDNSCRTAVVVWRRWSHVGVEFSDWQSSAAT